MMIIKGSLLNTIFSHRNEVVWTYISGLSAFEGDAAAFFFPVLILPMMAAVIVAVADVRLYFFLFLIEVFLTAKHNLTEM